MKKCLVLVLMIVIVLTISGCANKSIEGCNKCVFKYYDYKEDKIIGDELDNYTKDYTTLKDKNGNQRTSFLGHVIDKNNKILESYSCGIENGKAFCIQGTNGKDDSYYKNNQNIIKQIYDETKCKENSYSMTCNNELETKIGTNGEATVGKCHVRFSILCKDGGCKDNLSSHCDIEK